MDIYEEGKTFAKSAAPECGTYENCIFKNCTWTEVNLGRYVFTDCEFIHCDLSLAKVSGTTFNGVLFESCRLTGIHFQHADNALFDVVFRECAMTLTSFYGMDLREQEFDTCMLREADFTEADLSKASFNDSDLLDSVFRECNLQHADFRDARDVGLQLSENKVKGALFRYGQLPYLIRSFQIKVEP